ncbi:MAG: translocation/assembly module TamB domain-containing protein, partial [Bacteroidetes bacterium]|nr:translocation/assembly module TamB domain-containing protein [Bacteroidota bacterium]
SFGASEVSLSGTVSNIYRPEQLRLNIVSDASTIEPGDLPVLMPYFRIPDYSGLGPLTVDLQFVGKPLDFLAIAKVRSAAGTVSVDGQMVITEDNIHYKGILAGEDVRLEKVFASDEFLSRLNTKVFIEGSGTNMATLNTEARVDIDSSMFRNIAIASSSVRITARENSLETDLSLRSPDGSVTAQAFADFGADSLPVYYLSAAVRGLDLAPIVRDEHYRSNLSFDLERTGAGLTLFDNPSDTKIAFQSSSFQGMPFDSVAVLLQWLKDSTNNDKVVVRSPVVDGTLQGRFTFNGLVDAVRSHLDGFGRLYSNQRRIVDSSYAMMLDSLSQSVADSGEVLPASIAYDLTLKNLVPLSVAFSFPRLEMVGTAKGVLNGGVGGGSSSGTITVSHGSYADTSSPIGLKKVRLAYQVKNLLSQQSASMRDSLELKVQLRGDEIGISNTALRLASLDIDYARKRGRFAVASDVDSMLTFSAAGSIDVTERRDTVVLDTLYAKYQGIDLSSASPFVMTVSSTGVHVDSARLVRRDEEFFLTGNVDFQGNIKAEANIRNFDLSDIFFINTSPTYREHAMQLGGKIDLSARVTGTAASPVIIAQLEGDDISYRNSTFGDLTAALKYARRKAAIKVELAEPDSVPVPQSFSMEGVVPIDLTFLPVDDRLDHSGMDLKVTSGNLSASIFDIFVPEIDQMAGRITGSVDVTGNLVRPRQSGAFTIDSGSFRLEMNGIHYRVDGTIALDSGKILFPRFSIRNLENDYTDGVVTIGGHIVQDGFAPAEYHLTANGELLVLNNRSLTANQSFFGRLVGQTGPNGLRFEGTFERSRIVGNIFVQDAFMTFPPSQKTVSVSGMRFDDILFVDDTTAAVPDTVVTVLPEPALPVAAVTAAPKRTERTFLDGFGYELGIETRNNVRVQMIFNANAGAYEELVAELNGKMVLKKDEAGQQLIGTINVGEGSNYKYYKEFKATGSLTFVGDPQNPQLNILAKYSGTHLKNLEDPTSEEGVVVSLEITGNRANPKIKIGLATVDPNDPNNRETPRQGDVENDAIAFLLTSSPNEPGLFREELTAVDRNKLGAQLNEAISGTFVNNLLSGLVNEFIEKNNIPFVKRVEVRNVMALDADINTRLEVSTAVINIGGKVFTDVSNTNVSVQVPVLGRQNRNFIFEVEKKTDNADYTSAQAKTTLGARLFYRFTF